MIEYCSDDLETPQDLPEQFSIVGVGAQYVVGMLTGPEEEQLTIWGNDEPAPRVLKIPLLRSQVSLAVEGMSVDFEDRTAKVSHLIDSRQIHAVGTLAQAQYDRELYTLIGRPRQSMSDFRYDPSQVVPLCIYDEGKYIICKTFFPSYSQDYSPSITPLIPSGSQTSNGAHLMRLIDDYARLQQRLIARGLFDDIFKLDNYGYTVDGITVHDFSELALTREAADQAIRAKKWE